MKERIIEKPHLPEGRVRLMLIGGRYRSILEKPLLDRGVEVLWLPENERVDTRLAGHADLTAMHLWGGVIVTTAEEETIVINLTNRGFRVIRAGSQQSAVYPKDCGLCGCAVGNSFIGKIDATDKNVLSALPGGAKLINVAQGYAKCSVCVVDERSIITSDSGISKSAALDGIAALKIDPGFIELPGFNEGFIGGSSFKLSKHELAFTGTLNGHPDKRRIEAFLAERDITPVYLTETPIFDIGSAIPLTEVLYSPTFGKIFILPNYC